MRLTNKALRYMRDSNAAACEELQGLPYLASEGPKNTIRALFIAHKRREVWARERIGKRLMQPGGLGR